ncbi:hypothetical protein H257_13915 [Aphanomyces astaci]|uniref:SprT-like domain-containing protein n=1 Tax=Aphanomyces astaci TaxID=112090 RepID=W4FSN4_APHAT|nr:hypothetical protein H257_13915 [Aphanomyces astaci]ETV70525.1 hypothetical protein H257_13915 [Aphanomyces astaci]|eukprot:XP_009839908.1 hypothetical protein H257_13915 [Aphanomyces astaci]
MSQSNPSNRVTQYSDVAEHSAAAMNLLAEEYEYLDPTPDVWSLFMEYDTLFFDGHLRGCEIKWSPRMTLCAGLCSFQPASGFCSIRLSQPLLKLRPRADLVNTLLHEMIHAFLFLHSPVRDHEDHGPQFQFHMNRINKMAQTEITVFHTFHDEVDTYRVHWWKCSGPCQSKPPYFGMVKRAMNRPPGPRDPWWATHAQTCGGSYIKVKEPPPKSLKSKASKLNSDAPPAKKCKRPQPSIASFFQPSSSVSKQVAPVATITPNPTKPEPSDGNSHQNWILIDHSPQSKPTRSTIDLTTSDNDSD